MMLSLRTSVERLCLFVILTIVLKDGAGKECNELHAAYYFRYLNNFIYGHGRVLSTDAFGNIRENTKTVEPTVTAAVGVSQVNNYIFYSGKTESAYDRFGDSAIFLPLSDSYAYKTFEHDPNYAGIDAAVRRRDEIFYFAGCTFVSVHAMYMYESGRGRMSELGLPCDVDAAWYATAYGASMIVKGDQLYQWPLRSYKAQEPQNVLSMFPFFSEMDLCSLS